MLSNFDGTRSRAARAIACGVLFLSLLTVCCLRAAADTYDPTSLPPGITEADVPGEHANEQARVA